MSEIKLGKLERVSLRKVFPNEAADFTGWISREENLALLGETIGLELELEAREKEVGPFRADLLCKNTADDTWVVIENQFGKTNHDHLGKLLTYAAGLDAVTMIWITERFTEDHRATVDWLNSKTSDDLAFFGLEIELWRIGGSEIAPKFNVRSQPNDWRAAVKKAATQAAVSSDHKQLQLRFWTAFRQYMEDTKSPVGCQKASPQHWMTHTIGKVGFTLSSVISSGKGNANSDGPELRVELVMKGEKRFKAIEDHREEIEKQLGNGLHWYHQPDVQMCRVFVSKPGDFSDETKWTEQQAWLKENLERFRKVFVPIIKGLDHSKFHS